MTRHSLVECISLIFIFISITYIFYTGIFENVSYNILKKKKEREFTQFEIIFNNFKLILKAKEK